MRGESATPSIYAAEAVRRGSGGLWAAKSNRSGARAAETQEHAAVRALSLLLVHVMLLPLAMAPVPVVR